MRFRSLQENEDGLPSGVNKVWRFAECTDPYKCAAPLALDRTRLARTKPIREPVCRPSLPALTGRDECWPFSRPFICILLIFGER